MFRPELKVIDCTIRDGGLMNNSQFSLETVRNIYAALAAAGVDYIELGYRNSKKHFSTTEYGAWRFCDEDMLSKAIDGIPNPKGSKIAVMMDAHKAEAEDLLSKDKSVIDLVRIATYAKDVDKAIALANAAHALGYETAINIMAVSNVIEREIDEALLQIEAETKVLACYIVDSNGALYSEDVDYLISKYKRFLKTKEIGVHFHNNQQLAYANTIEAIIKNVNFLDGTLYGLGRAAGNCPLELLLGFLKNPKFDLFPVFNIIGKEIMPLTKTIEWGYNIPYMIEGMLNHHPLEALALVDLSESDPDRYDYAKFYQRVSGGVFEGT